MKVVFCILIILLFNEGVVACQCVESNTHFTEEIVSWHIIFAATVVEHVEISSDSSYYTRYNSLTKLKVDTWYQNKLDSDTIFYANGNGASCDSAISFLNVGDRVVLKAYNVTVFYPIHTLMPKEGRVNLDFLGILKENPIVGYHICDEGILEIKNSMVHGNITHNSLYRNLRFIMFLERVSTRWAEFMESRMLSGYKAYFQEWSLDRFDKLLRKICKLKDV